MEIFTRKVRPKYLDLLRITLPVTGWVSIAHRVTGVGLIFSLPLFLYGLDVATSGEVGFARVQRWVDSFPGNLITLFGLLALGHHVIAGLRFLLLDIHIGATLDQARLVAKGILMADGVMLAVLAGWLLL